MNYRLARLAHYSSGARDYEYIRTSDITGGVNYIQCVNGTEDIDLGTVSAAQISFITLKNDLVIDEPLTYEVNQRNDGNTWRLIGTFIVDSIQRISDNKYRVTCYDAVKKLEKNVDSFVDQSYYPKDLRWFMTDLCSYCGIALEYNSTTFLNNGFSVYDNFESRGLTGTRLASFIAAIAIGYIVAVPVKAQTNYLKVTVKNFNLSSSITVDDTKYTKRQMADYLAPTIDQVWAGTDPEDIGHFYPTEAGTYNSVLKIQGNPILVDPPDDAPVGTMTVADAIRNIYNIFHRYRYRPGKVELLEDYGINAGDVITVGNENFFVTTKEMSNSGVVLTSSGNPIRDIHLTSQMEEINQLRGKYSKLRDDVIEHTRIIGDWGTHHESTISQTASEIELQVSDNTEAISNSLTINDQGVFIKNQEQLTTKIVGNQIETGSLDLTGHITFSDLDPDSGLIEAIKSGSVIRTNTVPTTTETGEPISAGQLWFCTGTVATSSAWQANHSYALNALVYHTDSYGRRVYLCIKAHTSESTFEDDLENWIELYQKGWYSYTGTTWEQISNPFYIKSTYIDETIIRSPTIEGNNIYVNGDSGGAFRVRYDGATVGSMGAGVQYSYDAHGDRVEQIGVIVADDVNGDNYVEEGVDYYMIATPQEISLNAGPTKLVLTAGDAFAVVNGVKYPIGYARFG